MSGPTAVILRGLRGLLCAGLLVAAAPAVAQAAITVTSTADSGPGSLRAAVTASASGDTIDFDSSLTGQTITLTTGAVAINHALTITGLGASSLTIDGNHNGSVFSIAANSSTDDVTISGLTLTHGAASGAGTIGGGAVFADTVRTVILDADVISGNQAAISDPGAAGGGGVYLNGGDLEVTNSTITGNTVTLTGNAGTADGGGGIYDNGGNIDLAGSEVSDNTVTDSATSAGGVEGGGGIYSNGGDVSLSSATVDANTFTLQNGVAGHNGGGGVYSNGGEVDVITSSVDANTLNLTDASTGGSNGGGAVFDNGGNVAVLFGSLSENTASVNAGGGNNGGGAVFDDGGQTAYFSSTLSDNTITLSGSGTQSNGGGAIRSFDGGFINNATIAGNSINAPGGGVYLDSAGGIFNVKNTIIADNTQTPPGNCAGPGSFNSAGFNLESTNTCGLTSTGDLVNTEPHLGSLQANGGLTLTQALPAGSPAVDAGTCTDIFGNPLTVDQRGVARPQPTGGHCDIGAYELVPGASSPPPPPPPPPAAPATVPGTPAATSATGASFSGSVNPNGQATTVSFQYGIDSRYRPGGGTAVIYDQSTPPQTLPADSAAHAVSASAAGLVPNALYHVRLVATNAAGTTVGPDQTFTTPAGSPPSRPILGQSVNVKPVSGQVFILVGTKLVPLTEAQKIPSGAILDTRVGSLQLTAAASSGHKTETGVFGGAIFKLTQARNGLTNLALAEGAFQGAPTFATCKAHKAPEASAAASKTLQLLHASAKGKFRTTGRYSAATVRGTKWTIADRCDGTLTRDIAHSVAVTDFVRHKTIVLHPGQSYLASAHSAQRHK